MIFNYKNAVLLFVTDNRTPLLLALAILFVVLSLAENFDSFQLFNYPLRRFLQLSAILVSTLFIFYHASKSGKIAIHFLREDILLLLITLISLWGLLNSGLWCMNNSFNCHNNSFIINRFLHWTGGIWVIFVTYYLAQSLDFCVLDNLVRLVVFIVAGITLIYLIDYSLVRQDIDLITRNNVGTSGGEIINRFYYYGYHRLIGGFREPSHAGAYLLIIYSMTFGFRSLWVKSIIACALFLTGSIIVYGALFVLLLYQMLISFLRKDKRILALSALGIVCGLVLANILSFEYSPEFTDPASNNFGYSEYRYELIVKSLKHRHILCNSFENADKYLLCMLGGIPGRGYVFLHAIQEPLTAFGNGLIEPYFNLQKFLQVGIIPSFLSSFMAFLQQFGIIGLTFIVGLNILIILRLTIISIKKISYAKYSSGLVSICLMCACLIEEPSYFMMMFLGICLGLLRAEALVRVR